MFNHDAGGPSLVVEALTLGQQLNVGFSAFDLDPVFWERLQSAVRGHLEDAMGSRS
jgi:hypothetical protein